MKLYKYLVIVSVAIFSTIGFTGCGDDITEEHYYVGSEIITRDYNVKKSEWVWNSVYNRYECTKNVPEINEALYEYGTIVGTIYVIEEDDSGVTYEVQKNLPFVQTYRDLAVPYTEMISFDIFYGNGTNPSITFFIQTSDGAPATPKFPDVYYFKLALIWDSETA
ncbi:MAG: hypothetical protein ACK5M3_12795 [Dysgonomonas sp.]